MQWFKVIKIFIVFCIASFSSAGFLPSVIASEITDGLKATIDGVIKVVKDEKYKEDKRARRAAMREIIDSKFSYRQMSMRSLAKNWNKRNAKEQSEFINLFGKLLENSYASKIETFSDEIINYVDEIIKGKYALVKTEIKRVDGIIHIDYKLIQENGSWRVFDFIIEGVSMVNNYRSQFTRIIKKESFEALKKKMTAKIEGIENVDLES
tara:strand:- start:428 stop:1054 length:627 start_codon:yes stop_codon:yes gene_type:complete